MVTNKILSATGILDKFYWIKSYHWVYGDAQAMPSLRVFFGQLPIFPAEIFPPFSLLQPGRYNFRLPSLKAIIPLEILLASDF